MRVKALVGVAVSVLAMIGPATPVLAQTGPPPGDPNGKPDDDVEHDTPGTPGGGSSNQDASALGCPAGGPPTWEFEGIAAEVEAARRRPVGSQGGLYEDDLAWETSWGRSRWYRCNTNQGWPLFDYPHPDGVPPVHVEEQIAKPDPQFHPGNDHLVIGLPVWLTLENGGVQEIHLPGVPADFRAVPQIVILKTGIGNEAKTCLDVAHGIVSDLRPPSSARADPPTDACTFDYEQPSTRANAGDDRAYEIVLEVTYRIETRANAGQPWQLYLPDQVGIQTSDPELVRVAELQAVAAGG